MDRPTQIRGAGGFVSTADYDANGNRTQTARYDIAGLGTVPPDPRTLPAERKQVHQTVYDVLDRAIQEIDPLGHTTSTAYDAVGRVVRTTDERGQDTRYEYDAAGNLTKRTNPDGGTVRYAYDEVYRRIGLTMPEGGRWQWQYDARGRAVAETDPLGRRTAFAYDAVGAVLGQTNPDGSWIENTYDARNRLVGRDRSDGSFDQYTYDLNGNVTAAANDRSAVTLTYDALNRRTSEATAIVGDSFATSVMYQYDAEGNLSLLTDQWPAAAHSITYTTDLAGRLTGLTGSDGPTASIAYTGFGQRGTITYGNGRADQFSYDGAGNLVGIAYSGPGAASSIGYVRDAAGNPLSITEHLGGVTETLTVTYDSMGRPVLAAAAVNAARNESFAYDRDGNLVNTGAVTGARFDKADQLVSTSAGTYAFDPQGNLTVTTEADGSRTETRHDASNRILGIKEYNAAGTLTRQVDYTYDALGRRIKIVEGSTKTYRVFAFDNTVATVVKDGVYPAVVTRYLVGTGLDDVYAAKVGANTRYLHRDTIGSVRMVSDAAGNIIATQSYSLFGRTVATTGTNDTGLGFTARPTDAGTGMIDLRARMYDPALGRFDARDPISSLFRGAALYAYAANHPLCFVDPTGTNPVELADFGMGAWEAISNALKWSVHTAGGRFFISGAKLPGAWGAKGFTTAIAGLGSAAGLGAVFGGLSELWGQTYTGHGLDFDFSHIDWSRVAAAGGVNAGISVASAGLGAIATTVAITAGLAGSAPVIIGGVVCVGVGLGLGYLYEAADERWGITDKISSAIDSVVDFFSDVFTPEPQVIEDAPWYAYA